MIELRPYSDIPNRTFYVSTPDREQSDERLRELGDEIAALDWPEREKILRRLREEDACASPA